MSYTEIPPNIKTPAYVMDIKRLRQNLACFRKIKEESPCRILLATKAFSSYQFFPLFQEVLDGTTASGLYEARLGYERFGKEVHVYSPAYTDEEMEQLLPLIDHISFNSQSQLERYLPLCKSQGKMIGIRLNPNYSQGQFPRYDPCSPVSRFGIRPSDLDTLPWGQIDFIHVHALSDNLGDKSINLINYVDQNFSNYIRRVKEVNLGGGHYMTHPKFEVGSFIEALASFHEKYNVALVLEPGGSVILNAGSLVATVLDVLTNPSGRQMAIINSSAICHMIDVLEVPYRPEVRSSGNPGEKAFTYTLGGKTCLSGDILGDYSFDQPLVPGSRVIFDDVVQYNIVKSTSFNGLPLPDIAALHEDGRYEVLSRFEYEDFVGRLGGISSLTTNSPQKRRIAS